MRAALVLLLLGSTAYADPLLARDAAPTWRELTVVRAATVAPFDRVEVRRQRNATR